ncbi:MAG TPA: ATP-binding domain-containing protein [Chloroflexota bacterium]|nr:ATP-binding domain-containing protein [Chloroflexota bacterium]
MSVDNKIVTTRHPELEVEQRHLEVTVEALKRAAGAPIRSGAGGDFDAAVALEVLRTWRRIQLQEAVASPYFARIDLVPAGSRPRPAVTAGAPGTPPAPKIETYYIGKTFFAGDGVTITGWQAPIASLFYRATSSSASYLAPEGEVRVRLYLKRRLLVDHSVLVHLADDLDERPLEARPRAALPGGDGAPEATAAIAEAPAPVERGAADELMRAVLSQGASPWLRDIIATIEPRQYALIAAPADQVLVIQGVAGSGKTSIALHRLSYLIYPALVAGRVPPRCIVFGPNRLFLKYISAVLPRLGLQFAVQTTVADWSLERMGLRDVQLTDTTLEALLAPDVAPQRKAALYRRSRLKTSRRMGTLLERYVEWRRRQIDIPEAGWLVQQTVQRTTGWRRLEHRLPAAALRDRHGQGAERPFAVHRAAFSESVQLFLNALYEADSQAVADAGAQLALGQRRLKQAAELRQELQRLRTPRPSRQPGEVRFGEAPTFTPARGVRPGGLGGLAPRDPRPSATTAAGDALLRQTIRNLELAAERRQQEGETLIREAQATLGAALSRDELEQARRGTREQVERLVDRYWPAIDPPRDYAALLADEALLRQLSAGLFDEEEVALLLGSATPLPERRGNGKGKGKGARTGRTLDASDLPAMHYLFVLSQFPDVVGRTGHEHVVIDEAQDISELDLYCLRRLEHRQHFTLLGDLAQSIYGHRGLTSWDQAAAVFAGAPYSYEECSISYRTTAEITALANRVLRSIASLTAASTLPASPESPEPAATSQPPGQVVEAQGFDRHGPQPVLTAVADESALVDALTRALEGARAQGHAAIAIIAKTAARARHLARRLEEAGVTGVQPVLTADFEYRGGVVLLPVHLAKGLEFDAAIVVDADATTFPATAFDGRLLYVALTRALHQLHVIWIGTLSPHLAPGSS